MIEDLLQTHKKSITTERVEIAALIESQHLFTASELLDSLPHIGRASIFRAIRLFVEIGYIRRVDLGEGGDRYEWIDSSHEHHEHLCCESCGAVVHFPSASICHQFEAIARQYHFSLSTHSITLIGRCQQCQ